MKRSLSLEKEEDRTPKHGKFGGEYAFVTLLYGNLPYFVEAMVLARSLRRLTQEDKRVDMVLLLGDGVSPEVTDVLTDSGLFTHIISISEVNVHDSHVGTRNRWSKSVFNKIHAWNLTQYKKVMFVDADTMIRKRKLDRFYALFEEFRDVSLPAACIMGDSLLTHRKHITIDTPGSNLNRSQMVAGLILLTPDRGVYESMLEALKQPSLHAGRFFTNHEEIFLQTFFREWMTIHSRYQYIPYALFCKDAKPYFIQVEPDEIVAFHFSGYKPHSYLLDEAYLGNDQKTYEKLSAGSADLSNTIKRGLKKWLKTAKKVDGSVRRRCNGKGLMDVGDWTTRINYK